MLPEDYPRWGAMASRAEKLARGLRHWGWHAAILAKRPWSPDEPWERGNWQHDAFGTPYRTFTFPPRRRWQLYYPHRVRQARVALRAALADVLSQQRFDAVIFCDQSWWMLRDAVGLCRSRGVATFIDAIEWFPPTWRNIVNGVYADQAMCRRRLMRELSGVVGITRLWVNLAQRLRVPALLVPAVGEQQSSPLPARPARQQSRPFVLTYVGPMAPRDLPSTMLESIRLLAQRGCDARLVVVGDVGSQAAGRNAIRQAASDRALRDRVEFTGWVDDDELRRRLDEADALLLLRGDDRESRACFPTRLPQLLLTGRPIILSRAGDLGSYFRHRHDAWLVDGGHQPTQVADAAAALAADADLAATIGAAGAQTAQREFGYVEHGRRLSEFLAANLAGPAEGGKPAAPRPLRVMHVNAVRNVGGAEVGLTHLVPNCDPARVESMLACICSPSVVTDVWRQAGINVVHLGSDRPLSIRGTLRLLRLMQSWRPDVIMTYGLRASVMARLANWRYGRAAMITSQQGAEDWRTWKHVLLERATSGLVDLYIGNAKACCDALARREKIPARKLHVILNGIAWNPPADLDEQAAALRRQHGLPAGAVVVGTVGRLEPVKGHEFFVRAARLVLDQRPESFFVIVGEDRRGGEIQRLARELGVDGRVLLAGYSRQIAAWNRCFDIYVQPSLSEGMSVAILEAMFCGLPIVATDVGGNAEAVSHGENGLIVPARDPAAIARALLELIGDQPRRLRMAEAGRTRAQRLFSARAMAGQYEDVFRSVHARKFGRRPGEPSAS